AADDEKEECEEPAHAWEGIHSSVRCARPITRGSFHHAVSRSRVRIGATRAHVKKEKKPRHGERGTHRGGFDSGARRDAARRGISRPEDLPEPCCYWRRRRTSRPRAARARPAAGAPR